MRKTESLFMIKGHKHGQIKAWNLKRGSQTEMEKAVLRGLQLFGYKLCFLAWDSAWKLEPLSSSTMSGNKSPSQGRNQNVLRAPGAPTAWPAYAVPPAGTRPCDGVAPHASSGQGLF